VWGSTFLVISVGDESLPPVWAATLRLGFAAFVLTGLALVVERRLPRGAAARAAALFGFTNFGLTFPLLYWSETRFPSGLSAVLYATIPLSTALLARAMGLERLRRGNIAGALLALLGVAVIFARSLGQGLSAVACGALLVAATLSALSGLLLRRGPRQGAFGANAVGAVAGLAVCLPVSLALGEPHPWPHTFAAWWPLAYLTLAGSVTAFVLFAWLVQRWPTTRVSFISVVVPLVALVLGAAVRHERLTAGALAGGVLVLAGVMIGVRATAAGATGTPHGDRVSSAADRRNTEP
jgi:drug/metabolite transporter (DMT)-like permease